MRNCPKCGAEIPGDTPAGLCPGCSFGAALDLAGSSLAEAAREHIGDLIGRYKLLEKIGEGGWGVVYRAEQTEPFRRQVALKVVKLGMDTTQVISRFEAERQALALMDHPNIAKVLDAGATGTGRPYFVMDLVDGVKITNFCDEHRLPMRERLDLFMRVCEAVQHAHQKGIIHRDLKPSNILVSSRDSGAVPKVIDFGIAKATQGSPTDRFISTGVRQFIGTPAYTSPEQATLGGSDVDTRSDIYSLGVLLYELLTGHVPFDTDEFRPAGVEELFRTIREIDPPRPSARLATLAQQERSAVAQRRQTDLPTLHHLVRGDLDWIVMKALEKDRTRRYETANDLMSDIRRHLNNEPVTACPPSRLYQFHKLVRRNKSTFAWIATVAFILLASTVISIWWAVRAKNEAATSRQLAESLEDIFKGVDPSVAQGRDTTMLRDLMDREAERISAALKSQPSVQARMRSTIGRVYLALGENPKAEAMLQAALRLAIDTHGAEHPNVASALNDLSELRYRQSKLADAEALERQVLAMRIKTLGKDDPQVAMSLINLGEFLRVEGKLAEAESVARQALAANKKAFGSDHEYVIAALNNLGCVLHDEGKLPEMEGIERQVLAACRKLLGDNHPDVATCLHNLAKTLADEGEIPEAQATFREALSLRRKLLGDAHPLVAQTLDSLAGTLQDQGHFPEAETMYRQALAMRRKCLGSEHLDVALSLNNIADLLDDESKTAEAETTQREALAMQRKLLGDENPEVARSLCNLARLLETGGKLAEAEPMVRQAIATQRTLLGNENPALAISLQQLAAVLGDEGRLDEAGTALQECLSIREKRLPDDWLTFNTRSALGGNLMARKNYAAAEPLLISGYNGLSAHQAEIPAAGKRRVKDAIERLLHLYEATGHSEEAAQWKRRLDELTKLAPESESEVEK